MGFVTQLNERISATGVECATEFALAQNEVVGWDEKEQVPPEVTEKVSKALQEKAAEVFDEAFKHCHALLEKELTEQQAKVLLAFMDSELGILLSKVFEIRDRAYKPYYSYFQSLFPDIIGPIADDWLRENL